MATIVIDPGHGGTGNLAGSSANNATGPAGTLEKDLTLDVAGRVRDLLTSHTVHMTRYRDVNVSAADRAAVANDSDASVFVSIHFNGFRDPAVQGTEVLVRPPVSTRSQNLADDILAEVAGTLGHRNRGIKQGRWAVLSDAYHRPNTARCIVEVSFLTDPAEEARLASDAYKDRIAGAIASGIEHFVSVYGHHTERDMRRGYGGAAPTEEVGADGETEELDAGEVRSEELAEVSSLVSSGLRVVVRETMTPNVPVGQMAEGIDVSYAQSTVQWSGVPGSGKAFAICKATEGATGQDVQFGANFRGIRDAGLIRGAYHLIKAPWSSSVDSQVDNYFNQLATGGDLMPGQDLPPCLDIEYAEILRMYDPYGRLGKNRRERNHAARSGIDSMSRRQIIDHILAWCDLCERRSGWRPILYLGGWSIYLLRAGGRESLGRLTDYDLWFVNYSSQVSNAIGWPRPWTFWQYSSHGVVQGVPRLAHAPRDRSRGCGNDRRERCVDLDRFNGTAADLRDYVARRAPRR